MRLTLHQDSASFRRSFHESSDDAYRATITGSVVLSFCEDYPEPSGRGEVPDDHFAVLGLPVPAIVQRLIYESVQGRLVDGVPILDMHPSEVRVTLPQGNVLARSPKE
ncbi:hypothetical protein ABIE67_002523 [Streptomyces sp. V4I8]|uniref:hypothetical protein n=1 Tax=Streptomyces sp. V4I8 TaxID=3156469 RepID=UPI003517FC28